MLLRGKSVMDDALPQLRELLSFIPERLKEEAEGVLDLFEADLAECDVSDRYEEKK